MLERFKVQRFRVKSSRVNNGRVWDGQDCEVEGQGGAGGLPRDLPDNPARVCAWGCGARPPAVGTGTLLTIPLGRRDSLKGENTKGLMTKNMLSPPQRA